MKIKLLFLILFSITSFAQTIKWEDNMNGSNSISGLQARDWIIIDSDGGGTTPAWFQPNGLTFTAFEGHDSGYVASNYQGANAEGIIDHWLISPQLDVNPGDSLAFYGRSPQGSPYPDSIYLLVSLGGTNVSDFTQVGDRFEVDTSGWGYFYITFNLTSTIRFAINYYIFYGGDEGSSGDYIGLDQFRLYSTSGTTIQLSKSFTFGDPTKSSGYRLIGLPGDNNLPVTTFITGTHKTDWNVFYDNGVTSDTISNYLIEFNGSTTFNFTPGKGFWALSKNAVDVNREVNTVALTGYAFNIPLNSGWNIISNPFEKNVSLTDIRNANTLPNAVIHAFSGNFTQPTTMVPYEGYYFNNETNLQSLKIPYPSTSSLPKINDQPYFLSEENLRLKLSSEEFTSEVMIGLDEGADNNYDDMDYFAPPGNFEDLGIRLVNNNFSTSYKQLFIEHRPEIGEGQSFELQLKNATNKKATLIINGIEKFAEYEIYLVDERLKKFYDLKTKNEIEISGSHQDNKFSLLIGNEEFINTYKDDYTPTEFALYQNYPNPFNPTTFIRYQVSEKEQVSIKIYDVLGSLIKVLVDEIKEEGYYEVQFDGSELSSGIYLYEFESGSTRSIKKMTLLK